MADSSIVTLRRQIETLKQRVDALSSPAPKPKASADPFADNPALEEWQELEAQRKETLAQRKRDLAEAESDLDTLEREARAAAAKTPAQAAAAATRAESGARADERLDLSAETRAEASAKAGAADVQRGRELRRAGEFAWGPDGVPYGIYDDDGKLRLLTDKEQQRAISMIRAGAITRTREAPGTAEYPGQTPQPVTLEEKATLPEGLGVAGFGSSGSGSGGGGGGSGRTRFPEEAALDALQVEEAQLDIQKKRRDLLGPATVALQNHLSLIDSVEKMVASGQLKPEQANQYVASSEQNYQAALLGTTVAAEQERVREDKRARQKLGSDLLQQRLASGSNLAAALTSSAFGSDVMMPKGQKSLGYSPLAVAMETTNAMGGGPEVSDFARRLLMESGMPGQMPQTPMVPGGDFPYLPPRRVMPAGGM